MKSHTHTLSFFYLFKEFFYSEVDKTFLLSRITQICKRRFFIQIRILVFLNAFKKYKTSNLKPNVFCLLVLEPCLVEMHIYFQIIYFYLFLIVCLNLNISKITCFYIDYCWPVSTPGAIPIAIDLFFKKSFKYLQLENPFNKWRN